MNSRERVWKSLNHQEPDRIPIDMGLPMSSIHIEAYKALRLFLGMKLNKIDIIDHLMQAVKIEEDVLQRFQSDTRHIFLKPAMPLKCLPNSIYLDEWGIKTIKPPNSHYFGMIEPPLANATIEDLDYYP